MLGNATNVPPRGAARSFEQIAADRSISIPQALSREPTGCEISRIANAKNSRYAPEKWCFLYSLTLLWLI
jgi:hypothetical protein